MSKKNLDKVVIAVPDASRKHLMLPLPENGTEGEIVGTMNLVMLDSGVVLLVAPYHLAPAELEDIDESVEDDEAVSAPEPELEAAMPVPTTSPAGGEEGNIQTLHETLKATLEVPVKMVQQFEVELDGVNHVCYLANKADGPVTVARPARKGRPSYRVLEAPIVFEDGEQPSYTMVPLTDIPEGARKAFADLGI